MTIQTDGRLVEMPNKVIALRSRDGLVWFFNPLRYQFSPNKAARKFSNPHNTQCALLSRVRVATYWLRARSRRLRGSDTPLESNAQ